MSPRCAAKQAGPGFDRQSSVVASAQECRPTRIFPQVINTDLAPIYGSAIPDLKKDGTLRRRCRHRPARGSLCRRLSDKRPRSPAECVCRALDAPRRPPHAAECKDLLFLFVSQDIHSTEGKPHATVMSWVSVSVGRFSSDLLWPEGDVEHRPSGPLFGLRTSSVWSNRKSWNSQRLPAGIPMISKVTLPSDCVVIWSWKSRFTASQLLRQFFIAGILTLRCPTAPPLWKSTIRRLYLNESKTTVSRA